MNVPRRGWLTKCWRNFAFTRLELIVVVGVLVVFCGLWGSLTWRSFRAKHARIGCVSHLKNIGLGIRIYATDHGGAFPVTGRLGTVDVNDDSEAAVRYLVAISNVIAVPQILVCPADRARKAASRFSQLTRTNISYFVSLDVTERQPNAFLAGDRNLTVDGAVATPGVLALTTNRVVGWTTELHGGEGNVAMGDGSVQQCSTLKLTGGLRASGLGTNRLAIP